MDARPNSATLWWQGLDKAEPPTPASMVMRRATARALGVELQLHIRAQILSHPSASKVFTVVRGGTDSDHRRVRAGTSEFRGTALRLWAEAAALLEPGDPLRCVTVAHACLLDDDVAAAVETLRGALHRFQEHATRFVLWQNLGLALSLAGEPAAALEAYRAASRSPGRVDRRVAAISLCIVGAKMRSAADVRAGAALLGEFDLDDVRRQLQHAIVARRARGRATFWAFDRADLDALAASAPELSVSADWRVA
jgi:hypothetical protein